MISGLKGYMLVRWAINRPSCLPSFTHHLKMKTLIAYPMKMQILIAKHFKKFDAVTDTFYH